MKFTEEKLEKAFAVLLEQNAYKHTHGAAISRKPDEELEETKFPGSHCR